MRATAKNHYKKVKRHRHILAFYVAVIVLCAVVFSYFVFNVDSTPDKKRLVTFYDRGVQRVVLTRADTVKAALQASDITINPNDVIEPTLSSKLSSVNVDVIIYRSRLITIEDGSTRQSVVTVAQSPNSVLEQAKMEPLKPKDETSFKKGNLSSDGAAIVLTVKRGKEPIKQPEEPPKPKPIEFIPRPGALTPSKGAHVFVDSQGVAHRETYYDLPMNRVITSCGGTYSVRSDGAKIDQDGYILVAANLTSYPRCSVVETSMGPGKVYDTGGFALRHPYGFDLATDWTNYNGL